MSMTVKFRWWLPFVNKSANSFVSPALLFGHLILTEYFEIGERNQLAYPETLFETFFHPEIRVCYRSVIGILSRYRKCEWEMYRGYEFCV